MKRLQCGRGLASAETRPRRGGARPCRGFNVAADSRPRKPGEARAAREGERASMWPRTRVRGNGGVPPDTPPVKSLQCGRGLASAETRGALAGRRGRGELQCGRGLASAETWKSAADQQKELKLQCGRGLASAETGDRSHGPLPVVVLQCGRGLASAETRASSVRCCALRPASMWPRTRVRGNGRDRDGLGRGGSASMWPRTRVRGNEVLGIWRRQHPRLQCGRGLASAETRSTLTFRTSQRHASMWPRTRVRGNRLAAVGLADVAVASMWPRTRVRGNPRLERLRRRRVAASMWPRTRVRGNIVPSANRKR